MLPSVLKSVRRVRLSEFKRFESSVLMISEKSSKFELLNEALEKNKTVFDLTFGDGATTEHLLNSNHKVLALNNSSLSITKLDELESRGTNFVGLQGKFSELPKLIEADNLHSWVESCDAIVVEFGPLKPHFKMGRGLDQSLNEPLDLRMSNEGPPAHALLANLELNSLTTVFSKYGSVKSSKHIGVGIIEQRYLNQYIRTTKELRDYVRKCCSEMELFQGPDGPQLIEENIKKVFLALRMFVNNELNEMKFVIKFARTVLPHNGKFIVFLQTEKEKKFFEKFLFEESNSRNDQRVWEIEDKTELEDGTWMVNVTRTIH
eukprot:TRINITY_DN4809_c0_g1_i11.p1 TRINITY_DN4809_c0_g1~~TRINITY_DN4809_c0_g1_i11.p1  ORF type:complete len:319 (+),score=33.31 TRINITY_DN4809_c0_g1_i11:70-1026(+)